MSEKTKLLSDTQVHNPNPKEKLYFLYDNGGLQLGISPSRKQLTIKQKYIERRTKLMEWWSNRIEEAATGNLSLAAGKKNLFLVG
ncbi:hypothetical protein [Rheinheimera sp. EpRS3]|uniref:hypothetical protein n=1 Tax=Rheinheimera sp. EpRS3 TaxID=1712383 RepID=UPI0012E3E704|nr:hypothetical protein [Rheinheimera sp. EpRS3]